MTYSNVLFERLEIEQPIDQDAFSSAIENKDLSDFFPHLEQEEVRAALIDGFSKEIQFEMLKSEKNLSFYNNIVSHEIKSHDETIEYGTVVELHKIIELQKIDSTYAPPTAALQTILLYCAKSGDFSLPFFSDPTGLNPFDIEEDRVLFAWNRNEAQVKEIAETVYSIRKRKNPKPLDNYKPDQTIKITPTSNSTHDALEFTSAALAEERVKWRFLMLYRVFENGYLRNILEDIQSGIFLNAKDALNKATEGVQNEFKQFLHLVDKNNLSHHFEQISIILRNQKTNNYLNAIWQEVETDNRSKKAKPYQKGVFAMYQVRCSIVHSGEKSVFYDKYTDSDSGLLDLIEEFEKSIFLYIGVKW